MDFIRHKYNMTANTDRNPSANIWADCPSDSELELGPRCGIKFWDDFVNFGAHNTDQATQLYSSYIDTGNTITQVALAGGVIALVTDTTDNDAPVLQAGGDTGGAFQITTATAGKLWFEARIQVAALVEHAVFVGLGAPGATADNGVHVDDTGAVVTTAAFIGWNAPAAASTVVFDGIHGKASGTVVIAASDKHTAVADTWVKLGFVFDPIADTLTYYVNGVAVTTIDVSDAGTTNFPSGVLLSPVIAAKSGSGAAKTLRCDWIRCVQLL